MNEALSRIADRATATFTGAGSAVLEGLLALLALVAGWLLARLAAAIVRGVLRAVHFDTGVRRVAGAEPPALPPSALVAWTVHWAVVLGALLLAGDLAGLDLSAAVRDRLVDLLPRATVAAIVLAAGWLLALAFGWTARHVFETAGANGTVPGRVVTAVLATCAVLLAIEQLGLAAQVVEWVSVTLVASLGMAAALAFGLGCRELARDFVVELLRSLRDDAPPRPR